MLTDAMFSIQQQNLFLEPGSVKQVSLQSQVLRALQPSSIELSQRMGEINQKLEQLKGEINTACELLRAFIRVRLELHSAIMLQSMGICNLAHRVPPF